MAKKWTPKTALPSPALETGIGGWVYKNLFSTPGNTLLTAIGVLLLVWLVPPVVRWALIDANWIGDSRNVCDVVPGESRAGACWVFIKVRFSLFMYGFYPEVERWRVNLVFTLLGGTLLPLLLPGVFRGKGRQLVYSLIASALVLIPFGVEFGVFACFYFFLPVLLSRVSLSQRLLSATASTNKSILYGLLLATLAGSIVYVLFRLLIDPQAALPAAVVGTFLSLPLLFSKGLSILVWRWIFLFSLYPLFSFFMLVGDAFGLPLVETHYWGGLFLTMVVACSGMATALPVGILLALGRRSELPVIKTVCVSFIEFVRGVPLVSVLFMASVMFPLFLPQDVNFDKLLRALVGVTFFYAAYMAEVVRGGLQAIPKGQYEAAKALGWGYWKMMGFIILPQALRLVIPGLANNFLSLIKDTTLVAVIGLLDLLGIAKAAMADAQWLGFTKEAYVFAGAVFWIFCFSLSRYSVYLEKKFQIRYR